MPKCEFNKDVLQYLCRTASETIIFKEHCLMNASIFCSLFKVVHCLSVSITTDTLSKAIMDPSSVQLFSNIVFSITGGEVGGARGTLLLVFQVSEIVWIRSLIRSRDWCLNYGPGKVLVRSAKMKHTSPITAVLRNIKFGQF